jgi:hypothetical protein
MKRPTDQTATAIPPLLQDWMRLPSRGRDPIFGLSRAWYYGEIKRGSIRTSCLRREGCLTGVRLVNVASVRRLIEKHIEGGEG